MAARYVTTDLNLKAHCDLRPLVRGLEAGGLVGLGEPRARGGVWSSVLESGRSGSVDREIRSILDAVEGLEGESRRAWDRCFAREFDLGYGCGGDDPFSMISIEHGLIERIAAVGASLRVTIYREPSCGG